MVSLYLTFVSVCFPVCLTSKINMSTNDALLVHVSFDSRVCVCVCVVCACVWCVRVWCACVCGVCVWCSCVRVWCACVGVHVEYVDNHCSVKTLQTESPYSISLF